MNFLPEALSTYAKDIDDLIILVTILTGIGFFFAELALFAFSFLYKRKDGVKASYIVGKGWRQLKWVFVPVIIVVAGDAFIDIKTTEVWSKVMQEIPEEGLDLDVTGMQYQWQFAYPGPDGELGTDDDKVSVNQLHIPINTNILFNLRSRDVLHSFSVPVLRFKQDAIPGRTLQRWFNVTRTGTYNIACAEICGVGHSKMHAQLIVHTEENYKKWLASSPTAGLSGAKAGETLYKVKGCIACHSTNGSKLVGPSFKDLYGKTETLKSGESVTVNDAYIKKSITDPSADIVEGYVKGQMPPQQVSDEEIENIILYIKSLSKK